MSLWTGQFVTDELVEVPTGVLLLCLWQGVVRRQVERRGASSGQGSLSARTPETEWRLFLTGNYEAPRAFVYQLLCWWVCVAVSRLGLGRLVLVAMDAACGWRNPIVFRRCTSTGCRSPAWSRCSSLTLRSKWSSTWGRCCSWTSSRRRGPPPPPLAPALSGPRPQIATSSCALRRLQQLTVLV